MKPRRVIPDRAIVDSKDRLQQRAKLSLSVFGTLMGRIRVTLRVALELLVDFDLKASGTVGLFCTRREEQCSSRYKAIPQSITNPAAGSRRESDCGRCPSHCRRAAETNQGGFHVSLEVKEQQWETSCATLNGTKPS